MNREYLSAGLDYAIVDCSSCKYMVEYMVAFVEGWPMQTRVLA